MRGTGKSPPLWILSCRITPACAGNSGKYSPQFSQPRDHPRVCGEQCASVEVFSALWGSPPRVRGTVPGDPSGKPEEGITPACAGNSLLSFWGSGPAKDHPRVCGEQRGPPGQGGSLLGSPPRVRGTEKKKPLAFYCLGITPACAGNRIHLRY